jgi:hypothetical protein
MYIYTMYNNSRYFQMHTASLYACILVMIDGSYTSLGINITGDPALVLMSDASMHGR